MKLTVTVSLSSDLLDAGSLLLALPLGLNNVAQAVNAGIAATGPEGIAVFLPGSQTLIRVRFTTLFEETTPRLPNPEAQPQVGA